MRSFHHRVIGAARVLAGMVLPAVMAATLVLGSTAAANADTTTVLLTSSPNPSLATQPVTLTATVTPIPTGGRIRFQEWNDQNSVWETLYELEVDATGTAVYVTSVLSSDVPHLLQASYLDASGTFVAASNSLTQVVNLQPTTATLSFTAASYPYRVAPMADVHFTAIDVPSWVQVEVTLANGTGGEASARVATVAGQTEQMVRLPVPGDLPQPPNLLVPGSYIATARFNGGGSWDYSWSDPVGLTVTQIPTTTAISTQYPFTGSGEDFTVLAQVTGGGGLSVDEGAAQLSVDGTVFASAGVDANGLASIVVHVSQFQARGLTVLGRHQLSVTFYGQPGFGNSTSPTLVHDISDSVFVADPFSRSVSKGWGAAGTGGNYTVQGTAADYAVNGSAGTMSVAAAVNHSALLGVSVADVELSVRFAVNKLPVGDQEFIYGVLRHVGSTTEYRAKVRIAPSGAVFLQATALNGTETDIGSEVRVSGLTAVPGSYIWLRAQVSGSSPTTLRMRAWADGSSEPTSWPYSATNSAAALQVPGSLGVRVYTGSAVTDGPIIVTFDDLRATSISQ